MSQAWSRIVLFMFAGKGQNRKRFRHVVGSNTIEVQGESQLDETQWTTVSGNHLPADVELLTRSALKRVCEGLAPLADGARMPYPRGVSIELIGKHTCLTIELGDVELLS